MMHRKGSTPVPITIRGVTYPSHRAAATALGLTTCCISTAKKRGTLETVGTLAKPPVPVRHKDTIYPTIAAATAATGRSHGWIRLRAARRINSWSFVEEVK